MKIVYTMDSLNYNGGAHLATFAQIGDIRKRYSVASIWIISKDEPNLNLRAQLDYVHFVSVRNDTERKKAFDHITESDIVIVPFENSEFRETVSNINCWRKIQWFHIDYLQWRKVNNHTSEISAGDQMLYSKFDALVFVSETARRGFVLLYPEMEYKCWVCYNFFNSKNILEKGNEPLPVQFIKKSQSVRLVTVMRLSNIQKAIIRHVLLADLLRNAGYDFIWYFVGDGEDRDIMEMCIDEYKLHDFVVLLGHQDNPHVFVKNADLFCLFSFYEGIPNTIFESFILGTPVAVTRAGGTTEQLMEGGGWIMDNSLEDIYVGMKRILDNPSQIDEKRQQLHGYVYENSRIQKMLDYIIFPPKNMIAFPHGYHNNEINGEKMENPLILPAVVRVSVIVPVYNVEIYLEKCLDSLAKQTLESLEIIVINDGSTDNSQVIIDSFVHKYPYRFRSFIKENGGLGDARNFGMKQAVGEYLAFVDGDDWVSPNMMEKMFSVAVESHCDVVQCDLVGHDDLTGKEILEKAPYKRDGIVPVLDMLCQITRPVAISACTKLFHKRIFEKFNFPNGWYEDLGSIPIILSYFNQMYYLSEPLYYYRWNREGSIQSQKKSKKTLDVLKSQQMVLNKGNSKYKNELAYAIYEHTSRFYHSQPQFSEQTHQFVKDNTAYFINNSYILGKVENGLLPSLYSKENTLIPPIIHYCWFGGAKKSASIEQCISSWKKHLPNYTFIEWNETNCDLEENHYVRLAASEKRWAFVSDYFRVKALYAMGGIYLDTDFILYQPLDHLLYYKAFFPFETYDFLHGGILGASPGMVEYKYILESYMLETVDFTYTICRRITSILEKTHSIKKENIYQVLDNKIILIPANVLTVNVSDGKCIGEHLYDASWMENDMPGASFRYEVLKHYFSRELYLRFTEKGWGFHDPENNNFTEQSHQSPFYIVDKTIERYGVKITMRQLLKAVFKYFVPKKLYNYIEVKYTKNVNNKHN